MTASRTNRARPGIAFVLTRGRRRTIALRPSARPPAGGARRDGVGLSTPALLLRQERGRHAPADGGFRRGRVGKAQSRSRQAPAPLGEGAVDDRRDLAVAQARVPGHEQVGLPERVVHDRSDERRSSRSKARCWNRPEERSYAALAAPLPPRDRGHHEPDLDALAHGAKQSRWRRRNPRTRPLSGQRESRRPSWLRVHAPTRTQVSAPLMTSVSHLATCATGCAAGRQAP